MITVIDVFREMGVEPEKHLTWAVGQIVVQEFKKREGKLPVKDLRRKTCGVGVHCFALYPESYRSVIRDAIKSLETEAAKQMDMFNA